MAGLSNRKGTGLNHKHFFVHFNCFIHIEYFCNDYTNNIITTFISIIKIDIGLPVLFPFSINFSLTILG